MGDELKPEIDLFRLKFPMFNNIEVYPDERVYQALVLTEHLVSTGQWPDSENKAASMYWYARFLLTAHNLVLQDNSINDDGTAKANTDAAITGKSVGGISITFDAPGKTSSGQTYSAYDSTTYGREYLTLVRIFGAGCLTV